MQIIKRDGKYAQFDERKIKNAVYKALEASGLPSESVADKVTGDVVAKLSKLGADACATVEEIQDLVERSLMARGMHDAAKAFILYRDEHARRRRQLRVRKIKGSKQSVTDKSMLIVQSMTDSTVAGWDRSRIAAQLMEQTSLSEEQADAIAKDVEDRVLATGLQTVNSEFVRELVNSVLMDKGYVEQLQDLAMYKVPKDYIDGLLETKVNENSNIVANNPEAVSLAITDLVLKQYALDNVFSSDVRDAHNKATIYLHDLGYPTRVYCSSHSIEYIKKYGLKGLNNLNTISKPARSASVLTGHLNTFLASMQSNYAGALGLGYVNIFYAPLLKGMDYKEMKQTAQEMIFNGSQNAFSRGGQTLFLDYNIHTGVPSYLEKVPAIHAGGKYRMQHIVESADGQIGNVKGIAYVEDDLIEGTLDDGSWCLKWHDPDENKDVVVLMEHDGKQEFVDQGYGHILTYGDYKKEAMEFAHALLDVWYEGDARGRVFEFPKCDFHVSAETFTDPEQYKVYEHACKLASHNGSTYFVFDRDSVSLASCCRLRVQITDMSLLLHPEHLRTSFPRNAPIVIRRQGGEPEVISMGRLFDEYDVPVIQEDGFEVKYLDGVETWDRNGWTGLQRVMRHKKSPETHSDKLIAIRTDSGRLVVVTETHPMVTAQTNITAICPKCGSSNVYPMGNTAYGRRIVICKACNKYSVAEPLKVIEGTEQLVNACALTKQQALIDCPDVDVLKTKSIQKDIAYLLGAYVGDGSMFTGHRVCTISKPSAHPTYREVEEHAIKACIESGVDSARVRTYEDKVTFPVLVCPETLFAGNSAYYKQLPPDYLSWTEDTFGAVVSGLVDTDGSMHKTDVSLCSVSLTLVTQLQMYLRSIGIASRLYLQDAEPTINNELNGGVGFTSTHLPYLLSIRLDARVKELLSLSWKIRSAGTAKTIKPKWVSCERVYQVQCTNDEKEEYVYDVTTDSHTFVVNGLLQHNCGFQNVTINIPQAAYRAARAGNKELNATLDEIDKAMDLAVKAHLQKKEFIERMMKKGGPLWQLGKEACDGRPYLELKDCTYIIGIIGVNDAVQFLTGKQMHESEEAMDMALKIAGHMYLRTKEYTKQYGLTFKLEESPAESAARKIAKSDLVYFRDEALQVYKGGDEDHAYYTNSIHLAADAPVGLLERIDKQAMFNSIIEAGAIIHAFIGEETPQPRAIAELVREAFLRTQAAQITFSPEFTYCETCGRNSNGLHAKCPVCGSSDVVGETRIVGYFSKISSWNISKLAELRARQRGHYEVEETDNI